VCGADLHTLRRRPRSRLSRSIRTSRLPYWSRGLRDQFLLTILLVVVALFAPLYGMALAVLVGWDRGRRGHRVMRNIAAVCFLLALAAFITPLVHGLPRMSPALQGR
jgi:Zn-dependent protease